MSAFKRVLSAFLAVVLVFGMIPTTVFATEENPSEEVPQGTIVPVETEPEASEPEVTEPEASEPEVTEPEASEPEVTEPEASEPEVTEPEETEPEETEPEETEPEETEPEETEPEELERVPLEPVFYDWFLKEKTVTKTENITVVEQLDKDVFKTSEVTEEKTYTIMELEEIFNYPMAPMAVRGEEIPTTFESFAELKSILRKGYAGDLVLTYKGNDVLEITEDFTIPENVTILTDNSDNPWNSAWYEYEGMAHLSVFVPAGVELTVNGSLQVAGLRLEGNLNVNGFVIVLRGIHIPYQCGAIVRLNRRNLYLAPRCCYDVDLTNKIDVNNDGSSVYYWHNVIRTKDEFVAEMKAINDYPGGFPHRVLVEQEEHFLLDEDVVIAERVLLPISDKNGFNVAEPGSDYGITVAEGCTLTINSDWVVDLGVPMQINGTLEVNGSSVYANTKIHFASSGNYTGNGNLYISSRLGASWDRVITGLDPNKYQGVQSNMGNYWILKNVEGKSRLDAPKNLAWHKSVYNGSTVDQKGHVYWEVGDQDSRHYMVKVYNEKTGEVIRNIRYSYGMDNSKRRSLPHFLFEAEPSGNYYFTVTMLPERQGGENPRYTEADYYDSRTMVSPAWKYTKPSKNLGVPGNLTIGYPLVTWNTPSNGTKNTLYEVEYYFAPSLDREPFEIGYSNMFTGNYNQMWPGLTMDHGKGYYFFRVKAITEDVTKKNTGSWSELSAPYFYDPEDETTYADEDFFQANVDKSTGSIYVDQKVILKDDYTVPESTFLNIMDGGSVVVPAGVTLTVSGGLYIMGANYGDNTATSSLIVMPGGTLNLKVDTMVDRHGELKIIDAGKDGGGVINFSENGWVHQKYYNGGLVDCTVEGIPADRRVAQVIIDSDSDNDQRQSALELFQDPWNYLQDPETDGEEPRFAKANLSIQTDMELPDGFVVPETGSLHVESYNGPVNLTIPSDASVTNNGEFYIWQNCNLDNYGIIYSNRCLQIFGSMYNGGMIHLRTPAGAELESILGIQANAFFFNAGTVRQYHGAFVYRDKKCTWEGNAVEDVFAAFKKEVTAAAKSGSDVKVEDIIVVAENYTVPGNVALCLYGGTIVVPSGKTLTLNCHTLMNRGSIIVEQGGTLIVNTDIDIAGEDSIRVDGTIRFGDDAFIYITCQGDWVAPHEFSGLSRNNVGLRWYVYNTDMLTRALEPFQNTDSEKYERAILVVAGDAQLTQDMTIPNIGIMHVYEGSTLNNESTIHNYGFFYVWPGNTLNNSGSFANHGGMRIRGELNNSGEIWNAQDEYVDWCPDLWVEETGTVYNDGSFQLYSNTELNVDGNWYGNVPMNCGGAIYGSGKFNDSKLMMTEKQLLDAMKKTEYYSLDKVVRLSGKSVTLSKPMEILDGAVLYVPKGTTLTVKNEIYVYDGGSIIVEEGGKLVNNGYIMVRSDMECGGIFQVKGTYSRGSGELRVIKDGEYGDADIFGVDISHQTICLENPDLATFKWAMEVTDDGYYAGAWVETNNLYIPSGEEIIIPWNATIIINPTWEDQERYAYGWEMQDWVTNDGKLIVYGHIWVNSLWYYVTGDSVPANFRNNGLIQVSNADGWGGQMTFSGNMDNGGTIRAWMCGWLQTWPDFGRTWTGNAPEFIGGASSYTDYSAGAEPWAMSQGEFKKLLSNKNVPEIYLDRHVVVYENVTLNKPVIVGPNGGLIVDNGATVTVKSDLTVENGGDLVVYGTSKLVNQGYIQLDTHEEQNGVFCCYGTFSGAPIWAMLNDGEPNIVTDSKGFMMASFWDSATEYSITDVLEMDELKAYDGVQYHLTGDEENPLVLDGSDTLMIPREFTISLSPFALLTLDQNVDLYGTIVLDRFRDNPIVASALTIQEGNTLTIRNGGVLAANGNIKGYGSGDVYNYGSVVRYYSGSVNGPINWYENPVEEVGTMSFKALKEQLKYYEQMQMETGDSEWFDYYLDEVVTLGENFTAYSPTIHLTENGHIIVPKGKTLLVQGLKVEGGRITVQKGGTLQVKGHLDIMDSLNGVDGIVTIESGATLKNSGNISIGGYVLNEDETEYLTLGGGTLNCYGSYKPSGIHYLFREDVSYNDYFEPSFTGSVTGISNAYQVLPSIHIDTDSAVENGIMLDNAIWNLYDWYGFMGTQITTGDVVLPYSLTLPDRFELSMGNVVIPEDTTLTVNGIFNAEHIENNGTLVLGKAAETGLAGGSIAGNAPVFKGAYIGPETSGIAVEAVDPAMTAISGSKITIQGYDAAYRNEDGSSDVKLRINVKPAEHTEDLMPLEYVTFASSDKKILDPAKIVRNEDGTYTLNGLGVGTAKLTITSMATKQGTSGRTGTGGKMAGKQASTTVTITVTSVKAAKVVLNESSRVFAKSDETQTFTLSADILDARDRLMSAKTITWSTSDKKLATVKDTGNGTALVTVQKNVDGIALITAQVKDQKDVTATVDVIIQDLKPRLGSTTFNVNPYLMAGTSIDLVESYGNTIKSVALDNNALKAEYRDGKLIVAAREHTLKKQTLKNVMLHVFTDVGEYNFKLTVNVVPSYPKITVKQPAKLDLFYTGSTKALTVTAQNAAVTNVRMVNSADFVLEDNMLSFSEKLKTEYPGNSKYKLDNTVDLYVQLEGYYGETAVKGFKISTTTSKKTFQILSDVNGKLVSPAKLQRFLASELLLGIYEKSGKTLTLTPMTSVATTDKNAVIQLLENGQFQIGCGTNTKSRKMTLELMQDGWMRPQKVTFQFNIDNAKPVVKLNSGTLTMNTVLIRNAFTGITSTMRSPEELDIDFGEFVAVKPNKETAKMTVSYDGTEIGVNILDGETPKNGTYAFKATPTAVNVDEERVALSAVTVNVKITSDKPVVKLKKSTLTLNSNFPTTERDSTDYTVTLVDAVEFGEFVAVKPNKETDKIDVWTDYDEDGNFRIYTEIREGETPKNGTYEFKSTPYVYNNDGEEVALKSVSVKVKIVNTKPKVKLKSSTLTISRKFFQHAVVESWLDSYKELKVVHEDVYNGYDSPFEFYEFMPVQVKDKKVMAEAEKISVTLYNGELVAEVLGEEMPKTGKYQFYGYPIVTNGEDVVKLDKVTVTVEVEEKKVPTVKLKTTSVKLNTNLAGTEFVEIPVTFTNKTGYNGLYFDRFEIVNMYEDKVLVEEVYREDTSALMVRLMDGAPKGTYKIDLYPLINQEDGVSDVKLGKITLTVSAYTSNVKISAKTSGKLDTMNMNSALRYSINKVENALGVDGSNLAQITDVELAKDVYDNNRFQISDGIQKDASGKPYFEVKLREEETYDLKKTYKIQATYTVWNKPVTVNYTFKVSQSALKAKVAASGTFYLSAGKPLNIKVDLTSPDYACIQRIEFNKSKSSKELAAALGFTGNQELFKRGDEPVTGADLNLNFIKFGNLKNGATYSLVLNVYPEHHAANASPMQVTVKVKIVK